MDHPWCIAGILLVTAILVGEHLFSPIFSCHLRSVCRATLPAIGRYRRAENSYPPGVEKKRSMRVSGVPSERGVLSVVFSVFEMELVARQFFCSTEKKRRRLRVVCLHLFPLNARQSHSVVCISELPVPPLLSSSDLKHRMRLDIPNEQFQLCPQAFPTIKPARPAARRAITLAVIHSQNEELAGIAP